MHVVIAVHMQGGPNCVIQEYLDDTWTALKSFYHPSNNGRWTVSAEWHVISWFTVSDVTWTCAEQTPALHDSHVSPLRASHQQGALQAWQLGQFRGDVIQVEGQWDHGVRHEHPPHRAACNVQQERTARRKSCDSTSRTSPTWARHPSASW